MGRNRSKSKPRPRRRALENSDEAFDFIAGDLDEHFAFIAGHTSGGAPYGITWKEAERMNLPKNFDCWVGENNPARRLEYGKGWWDYIELIRRVMQKFGSEDAEVIATYVMETPPPQEELLMPVVRFSVGATQFIVKFDFGVYPERWTVSVTNAVSAARPVLGLFDERQDLRGKTIAGFEAEWIYGAYCDDPSQFTCEIGDECDLDGLVRLASYRIPS